MIIKNAEMELLVPDTDAALDSVTLITSDYGGYIISSHSWYENDYKYATVRLGVPVEEFENILPSRSYDTERENDRVNRWPHTPETLGVGENPKGLWLESCENKLCVLSYHHSAERTTRTV
jgi:hypothetical protein